MVKLLSMVFVPVTSLPSHHDRHVSPPTAAPEAILWRPAYARSGTERERGRTCSCRRVRYELIVSGGLTFIRRFEGDEVTESPRLFAAQGQELWEKLLLGQAV